MINAHLKLGVATLDTYILERIPGVAATQVRPCAVILPGGGYQHLSAREAEPVALRLCGEGLHACVLRYSVAPARWPRALTEVAAAIALLRAHADEWGIDPARIFVVGFSAGGHLAGTLGAFWREPWLAGEASALLGQGDGFSSGHCCPEGRALTGDDIRPDALVLGYPVITYGPFGHHGSFENLCGPAGVRVSAPGPAALGTTTAGELAEALSLENRVNRDWPATFIWHTFDDASVPVENSLLLAGALHAAGVPAELHVFPHGPHGSALGVPETAMDKCGEPGVDPVTGCAVSLNNAQVQPDTIAMWPALAVRWLRGVLQL